MSRTEIDVRVSEDPALIAAVRAAVRHRDHGAGLSAVEQVKAGEVWTALRDTLDDPAATPADKANAALRLRELGDPAGEAYLIAALSDPSPEVRSAALEKLWYNDGDEIDLAAPDRLAVLLDLIDDLDPAVARNAMLTATWRPGLPGAADRIAARLEAGTAPDPAEWGLRPGRPAAGAVHPRRKSLRVRPGEHW